MKNRSVVVRVPATVGNFGGAINCAALALSAPLNVKVATRQDGGVGIRYFGENGERVPRDGSNLVVQTMKAALDRKGIAFRGADFEMYSSVPVGVGLGSSTAAVLAGLIAADRLFQLELEEKTVLELATLYEDRSDNLRAAWDGGFVASVEEDPSATLRSTGVPEDLVLTVVIPQAVTTLMDRQGASSAQVAAVKESVYLQRARTLGKFLAHPAGRFAPSLGTALPEPKTRTVPGLDEALNVRTPGLLALFVCGSGPAVGIIAEGDSAGQAVKAVSDCFAWHGVAWTTAEFRPTNTGACEWNPPSATVIVPPAVGLDGPGHKTAQLPV